jgi:hypothetical protein
VIALGEVEGVSVLLPSRLSGREAAAAGFFQHFDRQVKRLDLV